MPFVLWRMLRPNAGLETNLTRNRLSDDPRIARIHTSGTIWKRQTIHST